MRLTRAAALRHLLLPLLLLSLGVVARDLLRQPSKPVSLLRGRVVDLEGRPLAAALLQVGARVSRTRTDGSFQLAVSPEPAWLQVKARGFLPGLRAVIPGRWTLVRLSPNDGHTLVIRVGGDVMAGRRFYTPEPESGQQPLLGIGDQQVAHQRLLEPIRLLLQQPDLTLLNLETALTEDPLAERHGVRSQQFHPTKTSVFASAPALASALRHAGVDVVGLANDHIYDALEFGLQSTLVNLERSGFRRGSSWFGAGFTPSLAWRPAVRTQSANRVTMLGCTTIHGAQFPISTVASEQQGKGGAALCDPKQLVAAIRSARRHGSVIVMVHGGHFEQGSPTASVQTLVALARRAGASLIVTHHPHRLGGLRWDGRSLVADSLGNLLFDSKLWPALPSMVLEVQMRYGTVTRASVVPLLLSGFRPYAAVGPLADWILQGIAVQQAGPWVLESGILELDLLGRARHRQVWTDLTAGRFQNGLWQVSPGSSLCGSRGLVRLEVGRDLLGAGSFEDELVGAASAAGALWRVHHPVHQLTTEAAHRGVYGVRLRRSVYDKHPVLLRPLHRLPVTPGQQLSLLAWLRSSPGAQSQLRISWFASHRGPSQARLVQGLSLDPRGQWRPIRIDLQVPPNTVAMGLALSLDPPQQGQAHLDLDDLALLQWSSASHESSRHLPGWIRTEGHGQICLAQSALPVGRHLAPEARPRLRAWPNALVQAKRMSRLRK